MRLISGLRNDVDVLDSFQKKGETGVKKILK